MLVRHLLYSGSRLRLSGCLTGCVGCAGRAFGHGNQFFLARPGQVLLRRIADDGRTVGRLKTYKQTNLPKRSSGGIPRKPNAIGMAQRRFAVVLLELLRREDEFTIRLRTLDVTARFVESVDRERAANLDRLATFDGVKHHPPAESARGRREPLRKHRVGPYCDDLHRRLHHAVASCTPRDVAAHVEIELRAAGKQRCRQTGDDDASRRLTKRNEIRHGATPGATDGARGAAYWAGITSGKYPFGGGIVPVFGGGYVGGGYAACCWNSKVEISAEFSVGTDAAPPACGNSPG